MSSFAAQTHTGQVRNQNQDRAVAVSGPAGSILLAVADGVAGSPGGEVASEAAIDTLSTSLEHADWDNLSRAFTAANEAVVALQGTRREWQTMATTLVAAVVVNNIAVIANIGDSRAYALVAGELTQVTRDDSWVTEAVESGEFTLQEAERHPWRNVVTKVIGMPAGVEPTRYEVQLNPGDVLLLATDGLFKMVADEEVSRILTGAANAESAAAALVDAANAAGGIDNIGVALYRA